MEGCAIIEVFFYEPNELIHVGRCRVRVKLDDNLADWGFDHCLKFVRVRGDWPGRVRGVLSDEQQ